MLSKIILVIGNNKSFGNVHQKIRTKCQCLKCSKAANLAVPNKHPLKKAKLSSFKSIMNYKSFTQNQQNINKSKVFLCSFCSIFSLHFFRVLRANRINIIINMDDDLTASLLVRRLSRKERGRNSIHGSLVVPKSFREIRNKSLMIMDCSNQSIAISEFQRERVQPSVPYKINKEYLNRPKRKSIAGWLGEGNSIQKTLNDKVFNLKAPVQKTLYWFNMFMNILMRILFILLLVYLGLKNKWIYLQIFLTLEVTAMLLYFIVMIKILFTRSDKESVYFQKIFNEQDWGDIEDERVMRRHFSLSKIVSKIKVFFNPCTKFERNTKISFLRQQIFKRMELVLVFFPFMVMFFIHENDFTTPDYPDSKIYITGTICLEILRTVITYLVIYIYS